MRIDVCTTLEIENVIYLSIHFLISVAMVTDVCSLVGLNTKENHYKNFQSCEIGSFQRR